MDLLKEEKQTKTSKGQKTVLILLIISIILSLIVSGLIVYFKIVGEKVDYSIAINGKKISMESIDFVKNPNGSQYVSLKKIASALGFNYYNGEFKVAGEEKNKGYVNTGLNIVQFYGDSTRIFKTTEASTLDYENYELSHNILVQGSNLFINMEDLGIALNVMVSYLEKQNQTSIQTPEYFVLANKEKLSNGGIELSEEDENLRALAYGYIVVKKDNKYGIINWNGQEVIGNKYKSLVFSEFLNGFIVSNIENKYGVISSDGIAIINMQYDDIEILNHSPLLYKVKKSEKYGVLDKNGEIIGQIKYTSLGFPENRSRGIDNTLIIPQLDENIHLSIVVCNEKKYGLLDLEKRKEIIPCELDGIYSLTENKVNSYVVEANKNRALLTEYIKELYRITGVLQ